MKYTNYTGNKVFIFGSNTEGIHGAGAAAYALNNYGAVWGQPIGLQGNSYAIITKDLSKGNKSISLKVIKAQLLKLFEFAKNNPNLEFYLTAIGTGLAGYSMKEIVSLFIREDIPSNIELCQEFKNYINKERYCYGID